MRVALLRADEIIPKCCRGATFEVVGGQTTQFVYDGDGNLVKQIKPDGSNTIYIGSVYEVDKDPVDNDTRAVTYYLAGGAMRIKTDGSNDVYYILKDHLGSASVVADENGQQITNGKQRYDPFGEARLSPSNLLTDKLFTGQREIADLRIYHYGARFYSPYINRFLQPDTIVPDYSNPQSLNRYSYVVNNPLRYTDPTGHDYTECGERSNYRCKIHKKKVAEAEARGAAEAAAQQAVAQQACTAFVCVNGGTFTPAGITLPSILTTTTRTTATPGTTSTGTPPASFTQHSSTQTCADCAVEFFYGTLHILEGLSAIATGTFLLVKLLAAAPEIIITTPIAAPFVAVAAVGLLAFDLAGVNSVMYGVQGIQYDLTNGTSAKPDPLALVHLVSPNFGR